MTEAVELEPCPFCARTDVRALEVDHLATIDGKEISRAVVVCRGCGGRGRQVEDETPVASARAIAAWNRRAKPAEGEPVAWPDRDAVALADCPPGLFLFNGTLGFKTEYRGMETVGPVNVPGDQVRWRVGNHSEAYVVSSGEAFWGGVTKKDDREALLVTPVDADAILALSASAPEGYKLVPVEPTEAMVEAYFHAHAHAETVLASPAAVWTAMLSASAGQAEGEGEG